MLGLNTVATYARYLIAAGKNKEEYYAKLKELQALLDGPVGEGNIQINLGFQAANLPDLDDQAADSLKADLIKVVQQQRQRPLHIDEAFVRYEDVFDQVWAEHVNNQEGGSRRDRKGRKATRRHRKGRKATRRHRKGGKATRRHRKGGKATRRHHRLHKGRGKTHRRC